MRLRRVEAIRFGALSDASLGDLSDALTVVLGPNEAGKSSFITLVRAVLYGFSSKSKADAYMPPSGARHGRLVFEDGEGEWVVERVDGPSGGRVSVRTLRGRDRPDLIDELTRGVSRDAYRIVFGFGLDEMARIEESSGSASDITSALYAASAGLRVSPDEIKKRLAESVAAIYLPRGQRRLNALLDRHSEESKRIRELGAASERYLADKARLDEIEGEREQLRRDRDEAQTRVHALAADFQRVSSALDSRERAERERARLGQERAALKSDRERIEIDARVLDAAEDIEALAHRLAAVKQSWSEMREHEERARKAEEACEALCRATGLTRERIRDIPAEGELRSAVASAREDLARLASDAESKRREAERAEAEADRARTDAARALDAAGLPAKANAANVETAIIEHEARCDAAPAGGMRNLALGGLILLCGLVITVGGWMLEEMVSMLAGPVVLVVGAYVLVKDLVTGARAPVASAEVLKQRRLLDKALDAARRAEDAEAQAVQTLAEADAAAEALEVRRRVLAHTLAKHGLPEIVDARAAAELVDRVAEARRLDEDARRERDEAGRAGERVDRFVSEVSSLASAIGIDRSVAGFEDAEIAFTISLERLRSARERAEEARRIEGEIAKLDARLGEVNRQCSEATEEATAVLDRYEPEAASKQALRALLERTEESLKEIESRLDETTKESSALKERLERLIADDDMAEAHLDKAAIEAQIRDAVEEYATLSVGIHLLERAQERYERERQPDVLREAERLFAAITGNRYTRVIVPLGGGRIEVFDEKAAAKDAQRLSKGTAEALYLALRLGLVGHLTDVGPGLPMLIDDALANFDPERLEGAARAIADLSAKRQIVFFTCHDAVADLLMAVAPPGSHRIELGARL